MLERFVIKSGESLITIRASNWECEGHHLTFLDGDRIVAWFVNWDGFWEE